VRNYGLNIASPWLNPLWQNLVSYKAQWRIPSGLLVSGSPGIGKKSLAKEYAKFILCQDTQGDQSCGYCRSCVLFQAGTHPDLLWLQPEETTSTIKIDQVRDLAEKLGQTSNLGGYQVAVISYAENMNRSASNALLKTLEEPQGKVVLLLLSHQPGALAATIRSRCQHFKIPLPNPTLARQWLAAQLSPEQDVSIYLEAADYLPMKALMMANQGHLQLRDALLRALEQVRQGVIDPIKAAAECLASPKESLEYLMTLVMDMIRVKFCVKDYFNHRDKLTQLAACSQSVSLQKLYEFLDVILESNRVLAQPNNVNTQLVMEQIFIKWRYGNDVS
jgi:DNA polymerase-3 subunit delta'